MYVRHMLLLIALCPLALFADEADWPDLSTVKFVTGRAATVQDVTDGAAAVVLQADGRNVGQPIEMPIPQYALYRDSETGDVSPVVIIQAERAMGIEVYGALDIESGHMIVSIPAEFELLGQEID